MKKIFGILSAFLIIGFIFCVSLGLIIPVSVDLSESVVFKYKFLTGIQYFLQFLPGIIFAGFIRKFFKIF